MESYQLFAKDKTVDRKIIEMLIEKVLIEFFVDFHFLIVLVSLILLRRKKAGDD